MIVFSIYIFLNRKSKNVNLNVDIKKIIMNIDSKYNFSSYLIEDKDHNAYKQYISKVNLSDENLIYYYTKEAMDVREILIIKCVNEDSGKLDDIENDITKRVEDEKGKFLSYAIDQYELLNKSKIVRMDPYLLFAVDNNSDGFEKIFVEEICK